MTSTISEQCETLYNKLNTFVASVISRDVTPKISNLNTEVWGSDTQTGNSRIDTLNTNFNNLDSSITTMESDINNVESDVSNLQTSVNSLNNSITNLIQVQEVAVNMGTISSGSNATKTATISACPSDYSTMILVKTTSWCVCSASSVNGTTLSVTGMNLHSGDHTCWITVYVVYYPSTWNI